MNELFILSLLGGGQFVGATLVFVLWRVCARLTLTCRLRFGRGLSYTWSRAWRKAGFHLSH